MAIWITPATNNYLLRVIAGALAGASGTSSSATGAANAATTHITANAGGTATLAARATRRGVNITCDAASAESIYFGYTTGVGATGAKLTAGQSQSLDYTGALFFYGAAGTGTVTTVETYD